MAEILVTIISTLGWVGTLVVWLLLRAQGPAASRLLKRHMSWKLLAWSSLLAIQTLSYLNLELQTQGIQVPWLSLISHDHAGQIAFRGLLALAMWNFIRDIMKPQTILTTPVAVPQIQIDVHGIVTSWNDAATALFGYSAEEMINQELAEKIIPESYREAHRQGLAHYRKTSEAPIKDFVHTLPALTKDQRRITVDIQIKEGLTSDGTIFTGLVTPTVVLK